MIRTATPNDAQAICDIWNPVIETTTITFTTEQKTEASIAKAMLAQPFLVFEADSGIAGFTALGPFRGGPGYVHTSEHTIMLAPDHRGTNVGDALMDALKEQAISRDIHAMMAGMAGDNARAIGFHARHGFTQVARIPEVGRKFERWQDLVLMQHLLRAAI